MRQLAASVFVAGLVALVMAYLYINDGNLMENRITKIDMKRILADSLPPFRAVETAYSPKPILILTYMRSGSTFLGDVIQSSPDVFYVFEPLWTIEMFKPPFKDLRGGQIEGDTYREVSINIIDRIFSCKDFTKLPERLFRNPGFLDVSRTTRNYTKCSANETSIHCAEELQKQCLSSKFVLIKTIRLHAYDVLLLKKKFPDLKVIYLVRDPRAVLRSQRMYGLFNDETAEEFITNYCASVTHDIQVMHIFQTFFPTSFLTVYYDLFVRYPIQLSQKLYQYLEIKLESVAMGSIKNITHSSNCTRIYALCTTKVDTSVAVDLWRSEIKFPLAQIVDKSCEELYKAHGFLNFDKAEHLTNTSFSSQNVSNSILQYLH